MLCSTAILYVKIDFFRDVLQQKKYKQKTSIVSEGYGVPVRLSIPTIKVNSFVESVGLTKQREMGVPRKISNVAWYKLGPRPGETGSAVIAAHYGWETRKVSAFDNLHTLKIGETVSVLDDIGRTTVFIVRKIQTYDWKMDTKDIFFSQDGKAHLNLITCNGSWSETEKSYTERLVVFTDKVE